jgi:DNA-binding MarR family transcriptional regulator
MEFSSTPTYRMAVMQSRANRAFKLKMAQLLRQHNLTMMQWTIIGLVQDGGKAGLRISDLAAELDTSMAFVTTTVNMLEAKGTVQKTSHERDSRAKLVRITEGFKGKVKSIEKDLHSHIEKWLADKVGVKDLETYRKVLNAIAEAE